MGRIFCGAKNSPYLCTRNPDKGYAQMAESVDALVSNTSGATHPGSTPGLGTELEKDGNLSPFSFFIPSRFLGLLKDISTA